MKMSTRRSFALIERPNHLVSRQKEMNRIYQAIFASGKDCRLILVEGEGGMGKSRLVEETLRRLGNKAMREAYGVPRPENDWSQQTAEHPILLSNLLDFTDIRLHTREFFMEALADPSNWDDRISFRQYTAARSNYQSTARFGAAFTILEPLAQEAEKAFWQDYQQAAASHRLVIPLDTTEQMANFSSKWLLERKLIHEDETLFNTQQWLLEQIRAGNFANTTFLIAGRKRSGAPYFDRLKELAAETDCTLEPIELEPFDEGETNQYIQEIHSWLSSQPTETDSSAAFLDWFSQDEDRLNVLYQCTGGHPIRLSLYLDVMDKSPTIPEPLRQPLAQLQARIGNSEDRRKEVRQEIEREFIKLLFAYQNDLPTQILRILARTRRGLNARQLHFVLDSIPGEPVAEWQPDKHRLAEIDNALEEIRRLSIVKSKPGGNTGLQDEMYDIYADVMKADHQDKEIETKERQTLYLKLQAWADQELKRLDETDEQFVRDDLEGIRPERPARILQTHLPAVSSREERLRAETARQQTDVALEYLHYTLLRDADTHFNDTYYIFANERVSAYQETTLAMVQAEMWRILNHDATYEFMEIEERPRKERPYEPLKIILRRAAQTDDAVKWIIRFILQEKYQRAIELADDINREAAALPDEPDRHAWTHPLTRGERSCWREKAVIYIKKGVEVEEAVNKLKATADDLEKLSKKEQSEKVFPDRDLLPDQKVYGFIGHPAEKRLLFVLSLTYNHRGYGLATLGRFQEAVRNYAESLRFARRLPANSVKAHEATTRNNLSRALVEMGMKRSIRICRDALELRTQVGDWLPIAYSLNTLGLIMNDLYRPKESVEYCARAYAIVSNIGDERLIGLALTQLGESLRRLTQADPPPEDDKEEIFREATNALSQALPIFQKSEEKVRLIEAQIEFGCLYRDWLDEDDKTEVPDIWNRHFRNAEGYLKDAIEGAHKLELSRLELDARVNLAWVYFHAGEREQVERELAAAERLVRKEQPDILLAKSKRPPLRKEHPTYYFKQLSKIYGLYGRLKLQQFVALTTKPEKSHSHFTEEPEEPTPEVIEVLTEAADYYVQSLGYAELFLPRSESLTTIYTKLYDHLKKMNQHELKQFYKAERQATKDYRIAEIQIENFGLMEGFLLDSFGNYYELDTAVTP
jgi:hypothetical protein